MKMVEIILIVLGISVIAILIIGGLYIYKFKSEISKMHAVDTKELVEGIYAIKDDTYMNMYLVKIGSKYVAIDAAKNIENVKMEMDKLKIDPDNVIAVLLTHSDSDHTGSIKLFKNAKVYISTEEEQMVKGTTKRAIILKNALDSDYEMIEDNQTINISGLKIKGILTPGHTPGSIAYLIRDKYLFTGDALRLKNQKVILFNALFNMDSRTSAKSIEKIKKVVNLEDNMYIFTAHFGYVDNYQQAFDEWKEK
ncbi:MAG: MBL fold metallo-hydrolase [Cellulosilyticaceae bacterium]